MADLFQRSILLTAWRKFSSCCFPATPPHQELPDDGISTSIRGVRRIRLLGKYFRIGALSSDRRQVVCRDLRPTTEMNACSQDENNSLLEKALKRLEIDQAVISAGNLVGFAPLLYVLVVTVEICFDKALLVRNGDGLAAAQLFETPIAELKRRIWPLWH